MTFCQSDEYVQKSWANRSQPLFRNYFHRYLGMIPNGPIRHVLGLGRELHWNLVDTGRTLSPAVRFWKESSDDSQRRNH
jgi:hypothetical protein